MIEILTLGTFAIALIICLSFDITVIVALLIGFVCFVGYGLYKGFSIRQLAIMAGKGQKTGLNIMLVLAMIGLLTASWRISGTIPYLVSFAVNLISPDYCLFFAFVLNASLSLLIGTAFGTSATMGCSYKNRPLQERAFDVCQRRHTICFELLNLSRIWS